MSPSEPKASSETSNATRPTSAPQSPLLLSDAAATRRPPSEPGRTRVPPPWRIAIENVQPEIDAGRFPIKRIVGDRVVVEADVFADGHDALCCWLLFRREGEEAWNSVSMAALPRDRWHASFVVAASGLWTYTLRAWIDPFASWLDRVQAKLDAKQDIEADLAVGAALVRATVERAAAAREAKLESTAAAITEAESTLLHSAVGDLEGRMPAVDRFKLVCDPRLRALMRRYPDPHAVATYGRRLSVLVERDKARFSAWYELFPRSCHDEPGQHGTFRNVEARLPHISQMGFDVLSLPPIHPIGSTHRRGRNNTEFALPSDPGSPWAIGSSMGGHDSVHPELGTLEDFGRLVETSRGCGIELAMDLAFHCSPDHPWVQEHPEWFRLSPDGTQQHGPSPQGQHADIIAFDFDTTAWQALWEALARIVEFWCGYGVRIFRVDNPHTKPFSFWEWLLDRVKLKHPDTLFVAKAFARPSLMYRLAKLGFSQSYTYFTWRNTKRQLLDYTAELTAPSVSEYFRPSFWPNTPDILPQALQFGGPPAFLTRLTLAATLSPSYGIYGPAFELCEQSPREPGSEEYLGSEKYEIRVWDHDRSGNIRTFVERLNKIRRENSALQDMRNLIFHDIDNEQLVAYGKHTDDFSNTIVVVVNLDPNHVQSGWLDLPLERLRIDPEQPYQVNDLANDARFVWSGARNFVRLDPQQCPVHVFEVVRQVHGERDFEAYA